MCTSLYSVFSSKGILQVYTYMYSLFNFTMFALELVVCFMYFKLSLLFETLIIVYFLLLLLQFNLVEECSKTLTFLARVVMYCMMSIYILDVWYGFRFYFVLLLIQFNFKEHSQELDFLFEGF